MPTREPRLLLAACRAGALDGSCKEGNVVAGDCIDEALGDPFLKTGDDVAPAPDDTPGAAPVEVS